MESIRPWWCIGTNNVTDVLGIHYVLDLAH